MSVDHKSVSRAQLARAYQAVMQSEEGQVVIAHLQHCFGYTNSTTYTPGKDQSALDMAYAEGQRSVLVHLGRWLSTDPQAIENEEQDHVVE